MKTRLITLAALIFVLSLGLVSAAQAQTSPNPTVTLLNPPAGGELHLAVGESYTFQIQVTSDVEFINVIAAPDPYYPGRAISAQGNEVAHSDTSAYLELTITGKASTADLGDGFTPFSVMVGVRYQAGEVFPFGFPMNIYVS